MFYIRERLFTTNGKAETRFIGPYAEVKHAYKFKPTSGANHLALYLYDVVYMKIPPKAEEFA